MAARRYTPPPQYRFRPSFVHEFTNGLRGALKHVALEAREMPFINCTICKHFNNITEGCGKSNPPGLRPPAKVIVRGCPSFTETIDDDDIPF